MTACSWRDGWRSLLLRRYDEPGTVDEFTTTRTWDQLIVLVLSGGYRIESLHGDTWNEEQYSVGSLGMSVAGDAATLRWRGGLPTSTLHLHLPGTAIQAAAEDLWGRDPAQVPMPGFLHRNDPLIQHMMIALLEASQAGVPDIYAETGAAFLAVHLLRHHAGPLPPISGGREEMRLRKVYAYMQDHLHEQISLETLSREAGFSRFHLLRLFKKAYGETPYRRLTRLRLQCACAQLRTTTKSVTEIAFACGYENSSHFASAFRRELGVAPSEYRRTAG